MIAEQIRQVVKIMEVNDAFRRSGLRAMVTQGIQELPEIMQLLEEDPLSRQCKRVLTLMLAEK